MYDVVCEKPHWSSFHSFLLNLICLWVARVVLRSVSTESCFAWNVECQVPVSVTLVPRCILFHLAVTVFFCLGQEHMEVTLSTALNVLVVNPLQRTQFTNGRLVDPVICTRDYKMATGYLYCTSLQVRTVHFSFYYREPSHVFVWFTGGDFNSKTSHWNLLFSRMVNIFSSYFCLWLESMISCSHLT